MGQDDAKNLILAAVLSMLVVLGWYVLFPPAPPPAETPVEQQAQQQGQQGAGGALHASGLDQARIGRTHVGQQHQRAWCAIQGATRTAAWIIAAV